ncbi:MAG: hypothetical protein ACR2L1_00265, partial [Pyrinomonadaceae bacterium]
TNLSYILGSSPAIKILRCHRQIVTGLVLYLIDFSFTSLTIEEIKNCFPIQASCAQLIKKFKSIEQVLDEIRDYDRLAWHEEIDRHIFVLLAGSFAEAHYLHDDSDIELPAGAGVSELFKFFYFRRTNASCREKVEALLKISGRDPLEFFYPEYSAYSGKSGSRKHYWTDFYRYYERCMSQYYRRKIVPTLVSALTAEKRLSRARFVHLTTDLSEAKLKAREAATVEAAA